MIKYSIIVVYADYHTNVVSTFTSHKDAIEFLSEIINEDYRDTENINNFKVYYESKDVITVHSLGYISKSLYAKYFIIEHEDNTINSVNFK